jgi:hypothetical protein
MKLLAMEQFCLKRRGGTSGDNPAFLVPNCINDKQDSTLGIPDGLKSDFGFVPRIAPFEDESSEY